MKLISDFRDFYDSVSHQYLDKTIIYMRQQRKIEISRKEEELYPRVENDSVVDLKNAAGMWFNVGAFYLGFCGKLYPIIRIKEMQSSKKVFLYSYSDFLDFANSIKLILKTDKPWRWGRGYSFGYVSEYERFFDNKENFPKLESKFHELGTPCFSYKKLSNSVEILVNPVLKDYFFAKVKDPFTAHQELYMFVSGHLNQPTKPMIEISDKDKIHKHGFDKFSFRKGPGPKK